MSEVRVRVDSDFEPERGRRVLTVTVIIPRAHDDQMIFLQLEEEGQTREQILAAAIKAFIDYRLTREEALCPAK